MNRSKAHVALFFKDFAHFCRTSCVGLHVAGYCTAEVLRKYGIDAFAQAVRNNIDIVAAITKHNETHDTPLTHVIISAPWLTKYDMRCLITAYPAVRFVVLCHSNVGFLQADPDGIELLRHYLALADEYPNFTVGGNSLHFVNWLREAYSKDVVLLPNLYPTECRDVKVWDGTKLRIGAFGAVRPEKNFMTAAAAAVLIAKRLKVPTEFHMSSGGEGDQGRTAIAISQMAKGLPDFQVIRHDWRYWDKFIALVSEMDLMLQPSYTESFNMVTADGISQGVPSVVSPSIYWAPKQWMADPDNVEHVAEVGIKLLTEPDEWCRNLGHRALKDHARNAVRDWIKYVTGVSFGHRHEIV